ncbi:hypothetical protein GUJ93_ZPchr0009g745 [Zizania palustris]|uniref:Uncharacterized protein n=1 Tax=Zizania palustris TaxID=103762 RepID=A0A8J5S2F0_ZIZPA|nr:hypothetical protein GUJ93_ZPchr0009g745 [Zizania palustris]
MEDPGSHTPFPFNPDSSSWVAPGTTLPPPLGRSTFSEAAIPKASSSRGSGQAYSSRSSAAPSRFLPSSKHAAPPPPARGSGLAFSWVVTVFTFLK